MLTLWLVTGTAGSLVLLRTAHRLELRPSWAVPAALAAGYGWLVWLSAGLAWGALRAARGKSVWG